MLRFTKLGLVLAFLWGQLPFSDLNTTAKSFVNASSLNSKVFLEFQQSFNLFLKAVDSTDCHWIIVDLIRHNSSSSAVLYPTNTLGYHKQWDMDGDLCKSSFFCIISMV